MFDYERKPYLQRIFGHLYIYHHKTLLHVWFSVVRVWGSADCCQPGPGPAAGSEGGGVVTRHMHTLHTLHSALIAPQLLLGCMKWWVTVTPSVKLRYNVIYLIHFYDTSVLFSQLFASRKLWPLCWHFHFRFVLLRGVHFVYAVLWGQYNIPKYQIPDEAILRRQNNLSQNAIFSISSWWESSSDLAQC